MGSMYLQEGNIFHPKNKKNLTVQDKLPGNTYLVGMDSMGNMFLEEIADMAIPEVIYGNELEKVNRVIKTYLSRPKNTGVILEGEKGSGKTLFTKLASAALRKQNVPTIIINQPYNSQMLGPFLESIDMECCVILDEFEKVFDDGKKQNQLLTILDGVFTSKKLFIITLNQVYGLSQFFKNRPGRFFYSFSYKNLEKEFIQEYCERNLKDKSRLSQVVNYCNIFSHLNFDMLSAIVEELNRYDDGKEPIVNLLKYVNASPLEEQSRYKVEKIELKQDFIAKDHDKYLSNGSFINPFKDGIFVWLYSEVREKAMATMDNDGDYLLEFRANELRKVEKDTLYFENDSGSLVATKETAEKRMTVDMMRFEL